MVSTLPRASAVIQIENLRSGQSSGKLGKALFVGTAKEKPELTLRGVLVYDQVRIVLTLYIDISGRY